jgi:glutamyl-tRNA synthetase
MTPPTPESRGDRTEARGTVTRLAPSPTGALHLGNLRTFLVNDLLARVHGWRVRMRIEDLDGPRIKPGTDRELLESLAWLGLRWEEPAVYQSERMAMYGEALSRLIERGMAYACVCSRKDIESAASAPHADGAPAYPGTCRDRFETAGQARAASGRPPAWRVRVDEEPIDFNDHFAGPQRLCLTEIGGDFVVYRGEPGFAEEQSPAYQLAVVVDDAAGGIDAIVRGDDLLESAARQIYLRRLLGLAPEPAYWHLPLVIGPDGRRLAKRHGDTRLARYREAGTPAERILGLLGFWCGLLDRPEEIDLDGLAARFDLRRLPPNPVVFDAACERFLRP